MKKSSNREAYERRKGKINSTVMDTYDVSGEIKKPSTEKEVEADLNDAPVIPSTPSVPLARPSAPANKTQKIDKAAQVEKPVKKPEKFNKDNEKNNIPRQNKKTNQGKAVLICGIIVVAVIILFVALYSIFGGKQPFHASFTLDSATAKVGAEVITMDNATYIEKESMMLPLNDAEEILPVKVKSKEKSEKITVKGNGVKLKFTVGSKTVNVNGEDEEWPQEPLIKGKSVYVPLVAFCKAMGYDTVYSPSISRVDVFPPNDKNKVPTASFTTNKDVYVVGETIEYKVDAKDSDKNDEIVEYKWENRQDIYDSPGSITISLTVMDSRGGWSETVTKTITIQ